MGEKRSIFYFDNSCVSYDNCNRLYFGFWVFVLYFIITIMKIPKKKERLL